MISGEDGDVNAGVSLFHPSHCQSFPSEIKGTLGWGKGRRVLQEWFDNLGREFELETWPIKMRRSG